MMEKISNKILIFLFGGLIFSSINVLASMYYSSDQVIYDGKNITNVLNNLYEMKVELDNIKNTGDATSFDIAKGKTAVVKGKTVVGTSEGGLVRKLLLGTTTGTYDVSTYSGYQNFNEDNFSIEVQSVSGRIWYSGRADMGSVSSGTLTYSKSYKDGTLTIRSSGNTSLYVTEHGKANSDATYSANIKVYLYY